MKRFIVGALVLSALGASLVPGTAFAGGPGDGGPDYGVMEPGQTDACPWPDFLNEALYAAGARKCLPTAIGWSDGEGVRIVTDPLESTDSTGDGWFSFACQSNIGLRFIVGVSDLEAHTTYTVTAEGVGDLATIRTNASGNGVVGGVLKLPPGEYDWTVTVNSDSGTVLETVAGDEIGFGVFSPKKGHGN